MSDKLLKAAINASNTIHAFYQWIDMVDAAGGLTCVSGVAKGHAMMESMRKQRGRIDTLVMEPLEQELAATKEATQRTPQ